MKSLNIMWTQAERERIVHAAVKIQREATTSKFQALRAGMKSALPETRWRNPTGVHSFGPYITNMFDSLMNSPESLGSSADEQGLTPSHNKTDPPTQGQTSSESPQAESQPPTASFRKGVLELVLPEIRIPLPEITDQLVELVEARVMERIQKIMQASSLIQPPQTPPKPAGDVADCNDFAREDEPPSQEPPRLPSEEGPKLHVVLLGILPQRKQWLTNAIPARLRNRLTLAFRLSYPGAAALPKDHIVVHSTMAEEPLALPSQDRYYRCSLNMQSVLKTLLFGADFHLNQMDTNQ